jgi:succinate dehydrogenase / fumarate reductase cytochrome b subunit
MLARAFKSSIGRKQAVALTGLFLCGFLVAHLAGNLLLLAGREKFDGYVRALEDSPVLVIGVEIVLAVAFGLHVALAGRLTVENFQARGTRYHAAGGRGAKTLGSSTMIASGTVIFIFLVIHLANFKLADRPDGSLYNVVVRTFQGSAAYAIWYVIASVILGLHLSHGFQSAFRTLGLDHPRHGRTIRAAGLGFAVIMAAGYSLLPVYCRWFAVKVSP